MAGLGAARPDQPRPRPRRAEASCCSRPTSADAAKQRLAAMEDTVTTELRRQQPRIDIGDVSTSGGRLSFMVRDPTQVDAAVERMRDADPAGRR